MQIYRKNKEAIVGSLYLGGCHVFRILFIFMAFRFAHFANLNKGVIAGIFTSGVMFTTLLFWRVYNERLTIVKLVGIALIICGVICVGYNPSQTTESSATVFDLNTLFAALSACGVGAMSTAEAIGYRYYPSKTGLTEA